MTAYWPQLHRPKTITSFQKNVKIMVAALLQPQMYTAVLASQNGLAQQIVLTFNGSFLLHFIYPDFPPLVELKVVCHPQELAHLATTSSKQTCFSFLRVVASCCGLCKCLCQRLIEVLICFFHSIKYKVCGILWDCTSRFIVCRGGRQLSLLHSLRRLIVVIFIIQVSNSIQKLCACETALAVGKSACPFQNGQH